MGAQGVDTVDFGTGVGVTRDATKLWWLPASDVEWQRLLFGTRLLSWRTDDIPTPLFIWRAQDASAPILEANGSGVDGNLQAGTAANFQQATAGWSRFGIKAPTDVDTTRYTVTPGDKLVAGRPVFYLQVRHINTTSGAGSRTLSGFTGGVTMRTHLAAASPALIAQYASASMQLAKDLSGDVIIGTLINPQAPVATQRYMTLNDQYRDNLMDSSVVTDLSGNGIVAMMGAPTGGFNTSDASLMYAALWCGPRVYSAPLMMADGYEIIRRIKEGPAKPFPGGNRAVKTITGQAGVGASTAIEAWIQGTDSTTDHNAYAHATVPIKVSAENRVNGVGFDIVATCDRRLTGTFQVRWVWN